MNAGHGRSPCLLGLCVRGLLAIAASLLYLLLVALPAAQRRRDDLDADLAATQARDKQVSDCAEQARRAAEDFGKHSSSFGPPPAVTGESNHYNQKLGKCLVDVETMGNNNMTEFVLDAYEESNIIWCMTHFPSKSTELMKRTCMESQNKNVDPDEAERRIDVLMRE